MVKLFSVMRLGKLFLFLSALGLGVFPSWSLTRNRVAQSSLSRFSGISMGTSEEGVGYMSGGVGLEEREAMESWGADYNLKLAFAELSGGYLSDVRVIMEDQKDKEILSVTSNGPWLYVQVPPGVYDVKATFEGETKEIENLRVPEGQRVSEFFHWDLD